MSNSLSRPSPRARWWPPLIVALALPALALADGGAFTPWLARYGVWVVFAAIFAEGIGIPAPGQTLMIAAAIAADEGGGVNATLLFAGCVAAAVAGNSVGYFVGGHGGRRALKWLRVSEKRLAPLEAAVEKRGAWLVLFARFVDGPKQLNGIASGLFRMDWRRFTFANIAGALLWVGTFVGGTIYLDEHSAQIVEVLAELNPWVGIFVSLLLTLLLWRVHERNAHRR